MVSRLSVLMPLASGSRLGPYEIVAPLGAGGMGEVYRARDTRLGREVAVKVLPASVSTAPERLRGFEQEARAAAALNHPNILVTYDVGQDDGVSYIVSELLHGETLRERFGHYRASEPASSGVGGSGDEPARTSGTGSLSVRKVLKYAIQIAQGLAAAHETGIVHRDLKPESVFVTTGGRVKILDFGLAKLTETQVALAGLTTLPTSPPGTQAGVALGTVGYMSSEQVCGQPADHRSDIFSFGAVLYEMLSGRRAFGADSAIETMNAILKEEPPELVALNRAVPAGLQRFSNAVSKRARRSASTTAIARSCRSCIWLKDSGSGGS
jgi:serine/threonine protein kinase